MFCFHYTLTDNDYYRFRLNFVLHTRLGKNVARMYKYLVLFIILVSMIPFVKYLEALERYIALFVFINTGIAWLFTYKQIMIGQIKSSVKKQIKNKQISFPQNGTLSLDEQLISNEGALLEGMISYNLIDSIYMTNEAIYIFITSTSAVILPYRFIESQDEFNTLVDFLQVKTGKTIINITE